MSAIRVLLVDDQALFVESLKTVIEHSAPDIEVVGIARNGREAVALTGELLPDIVVMDVRMPDMDGVEAAKEIGAGPSGARVMMLTTFEDDEYVKEALEHGAVGYILKDIPPSDLIAAVRAVAAGAYLIAPRVARQLIKRAYVKPEFGARPEPEWLGELSKREREILARVVDGASNKEIAAELFIAEQTVRHHISAIYDKMGVADRAQAVRMARDSTKT